MKNQNQLKKSEEIQIKDLQTSVDTALKLIIDTREGSLRAESMKRKIRQLVVSKML
jgi:hypothetical protein